MTCLPATAKSALKFVGTESYAYPQLMDTSMRLQLNVELAEDSERRVFAR